MGSSHIHLHCQHLMFFFSLFFRFFIFSFFFDDFLCSHKKQKMTRNASKKTATNLSFRDCKVILATLQVALSENLTSHLFFLAFSFAPISFVLVLRSTPNVSGLVATSTPSLFLHWKLVFQTLTRRENLTLSSRPPVIDSFNPSFSSSLFIAFKSFFCNPHQLFVPRGGYTFMTSLNASCITMRKSSRENGHDGLQRFRPAFLKLHSPLMLKETAQHTQNLLGEVEVCVRCPSPHHWKANPLKSFSQIKHQCDCNWVSFASSVIATFRVARFSVQTRKLWLVVGVATDRDAHHLGPARM